MHQVCAGRMTPVYGAMKRAVRVVLVEKVIDALPLDHPVRVVHPVGGGQEVISRALRIVHHALFEQQRAAIRPNLGVVAGHIGRKLKSEAACPFPYG